MKKKILTLFLLVALFIGAIFLNKGPTNQELSKNINYLDTAIAATGTPQVSSATVVKSGVNTFLKVNITNPDSAAYLHIGWNTDSVNTNTYYVQVNGRSVIYVGAKSGTYTFWLSSTGTGTGTLTPVKQSVTVNVSTTDGCTNEVKYNQTGSGTLESCYVSVDGEQAKLDGETRDKRLSCAEGYVLGESATAQNDCDTSKGYTNQYGGQTVSRAYCRYTIKYTCELMGTHKQIKVNTYYNETATKTENYKYTVDLVSGKEVRIYYSNYQVLKNLNGEIITPSGTKRTISLGSGTKDGTRDQYYISFTPTEAGIYKINILNVPVNTSYRFGVFQAGTTNESVIDLVNQEENNKTSTKIPVYRLYNKNNGEHLYTTDSNEVVTLYKNYEWAYEGVAWYSNSTGTPIYRLYNRGLGSHLYTTDQNEMNELTTKWGWVYDNNQKPLFYSSGSVPIYRLYNPILNGLHHWTTDQNEYKVLPNYNWAQEGVKFNAMVIGTPTITQYYNVNF